ncbi:MAG: alcohol dehydrogenase catalytic domain-containing protein [Myxococcales bacterium]|nr:alcohol dehydrogenase catalytic domain-containing protein [Myxococcales bacterium]
MKQLMFVGTGKLAWHEVPEPELQAPRDALVRPLAVARCDLDSAFFRRPLGRALQLGLASHMVDPVVCDIADDPPYAPPIPIGHECVAEVLELGREVSHVRVGERVVVPFQVACGHCPTCARGVTSRCTAGALSVNNFGFGPGAHVHGGVMTDIVRVPFADAMLVPVPDGVDTVAVASASDNLPDAYRAVAGPLRERPGASVLVVGGNAKSVGLYAAAIAKALGASEVDYCDVDDERLAIAQHVGARPVQGRRARWSRAFRSLGRRYTISVDASSDVQGRGLELALRSLEPGGVCTSVGIYPRARTPVPLMQMYVDGITLRTGITNARALIPRVLSLVAEGRLDPAPVTTLLTTWSDAQRALLAQTTKVVVAR